VHVVVVVCMLWLLCACCGCCVAGKSESVLELLLLSTGSCDSPVTHQVHSSAVRGQFWLISGKQRRIQHVQYLFVSAWMLLIGWQEGHAASSLPKCLLLGTCLTRSTWKKWPVKQKQSVYYCYCPSYRSMRKVVYIFFDKRKLKQICFVSVLFQMCERPYATCILHISVWVKTFCPACFLESWVRHLIITFSAA